MDRALKNNKSNMAVILILLLAVALNFYTYRNSPVIDIFALFYGLLILRLFSEEDFQGKIYFLTILFGVLNATLQISIKSRYGIYCYYISDLIYVICMLKNYKLYDFKKIIRNKYFIFLAAFIVYMFLSVFWADDKGAARDGIETYILMLTFFIVIVDYNSKPNNIKKTIKYLMCILPGIMIIGLVECTGYRFNISNHYIVENLYSIWPNYVRQLPTTFFYNPNNYAVFIAFSMIFLFVAMLYCRNKREKYAAGGLYFISQILLIFSMSRTAWISLFLMLLFAAVVFTFNRQKSCLLKTFYIIIATLVVFYTLSIIPYMAPFYSKLKNTTSTPVVGASGSDSERLTLIVNIVRGVLGKCRLLGYGVGNVQGYLKSISNTHGISDPHSMWFEILGDFGVLVFVSYAAVYIMMMYDIFKAYIKDKNFGQLELSVLICFFGFIFLSFGPSSVISFTPFWMMLGLGVSIINKAGECKHEYIGDSKLVSEQTKQF